MLFLEFTPHNIYNALKKIVFTELLIFGVNGVLLCITE